MNKNKLILIAGGTASGKTYISKEMQKTYQQNGKTATLIELDNYYKTISEIGKTDPSDVNWDEPSIFDWVSIKRDINKIINGETVIRRRYDFNTCEYGDETITFEPAEFIIIEGLYALYDEEIRNLASTKIFVNTDPEIRMMRRIKRDSEGRQKEVFNLDIFMTNWEKTIKPMHTKYIHPTKEFADIVIKNQFEDETQNDSLMTLFNNIMVK